MKKDVLALALAGGLGISGAANIAYAAPRRAGKTRQVSGGCGPKPKRGAVPQAIVEKRQLKTAKRWAAYQRSIDNNPCLSRI